MKSLTEKIRLLRHSRGWSQSDVAKQLGLTVPGYSKIETGITDISISRIEQLAAVYDMTAAELLTFSDLEKHEEHVDDLQQVKQILDKQGLTLTEILEQVAQMIAELKSKKGGNK